VELHEEGVGVKGFVVKHWEICASASDVRLYGRQGVSRREEAAIEPVGLGAFRHGKDVGKELGRPIGQELIAQVGAGSVWRRRFDAIDQIAQDHRLVVYLDAQMAVFRLEKLGSLSA
jgi:hypothetical protein